MKTGIWFILLISLNREIFGYTDKTTADWITNFGYASEEHTVTTQDGYILTIFRIRTARNPSINSLPKPAVLLMHGLVSSSDSWLLNGPKNALAFNLADSGYDVWLGNCRGTPYGYRHATLQPNQKNFWQFSIHELGTLDLPAIIEYILQRTRQRSLHYIGHSQGTTVLLILLSTQPQFNQKIKTCHLLAPVAFMKNARTPIIRILSPVFKNYTPLNSILGDRPLLQSQLGLTFLGFTVCRRQQASLQACSQILYELSGGYSGYLNTSLLPLIFETFPASCSTHQLIHLVQLYGSGQFHPYNYGTSGNLQRYGQFKPPNYKISNINTKYPLHLYYSDYDEFSTKSDVERLSAVMGNQTVRHFIDRPNFAHIDFLWASIVREEINRKILPIMYEAEVTK